MEFTEPGLKRGVSPVGEFVVRVGVPLLDDYLEFLAGRGRPSELISSLFALGGGVQNELEDLLAIGRPRPSGWTQGCGTAVSRDRPRPTLIVAPISETGRPAPVCRVPPTRDPR